MLSLYQLGVEHQNLFSQLYDHETGEVNIDVEEKLNELSISTEKKCIAVASYIRKLEHEEKELENLLYEVQERKKAYDKEIDKMTNYLKSNMENCNITEVSCPYFTLKIKKNPYSTEIYDENQLPEKYMVTKEIIKTETKPDKNAIKEEVLATGIQIPGANVEQKTKLQISINKL